MKNPADDPPSSKGKLFAVVLVVIGLLILFSMILFFRSRRSEPAPSQNMTTSVSVSVLECRG